MKHTAWVPCSAWGTRIKMFQLVALQFGAHSAKARLKAVANTLHTLADVELEDAWGCNPFRHPRGCLPIHQRYARWQSASEEKNSALHFGSRLPFSVRPFLLSSIGSTRLGGANGLGAECENWEVSLRRRCFMTILRVIIINWDTKRQQLFRILFEMRFPTHCIGVQSAKKSRNSSCWIRFYFHGTCEWRNHYSNLWKHLKATLKQAQTDPGCGRLVMWTAFWPITIYRIPSVIDESKFVELSISPRASWWAQAESDAGRPCGRLVFGF